jgi:hypothetical protein
LPFTSILLETKRYGARGKTGVPSATHLIAVPIWVAPSRDAEEHFMTTTIANQVSNLIETMAAQPSNEAMGEFTRDKSDLGRPSPNKRRPI